MSDRRPRPKDKRKARARGHSRRRGNGLWIGVAVVAVLVVGILGLRAAGVFDPPPAEININDPRFNVGPEGIGEKVDDEGNTHVSSGQQVTYRTNPPASGAHWGAPAGPVPWGIKDSELPEESVVHNLEHGGIVIWYSGLTDDEVAELQGLVRALRSQGFNKIILMPYASLQDAKVALTAWTWLLKLDEYDEVPIVQFVKTRYQPIEAPERNVP
ncbi:MAG TPA: DUF3105 domain-containing protein [Candidatus Limnocylindrales bacterium]|nr:DUF3105 domain-containing protein [Candidatus Limnocylindrales bacterium]